MTCSGVSNSFGQTCGKVFDVTKPLICAWFDRPGIDFVWEHAGSISKPKPDTKPTRGEKAAQKEKVRDAVRVPPVDLAPGDLTSESNA
jgi:hypothetical protein